MKKIFSLVALIMAAFTFTSCEDVPMPYDYPGTGGGGSDVTEKIEPTGSGTAEDPYNIAALIEYASTLESGQKSPDQKYFKGKVVSIKEAPGNTYGNATFYLSDDGKSKNQFYVYRCFGLGNKKFTTADEGIFVEGDELVICGTITNYNGTLETDQNAAYIVSINGNGSPVTPDVPDGEAKGDGTLDNPFNVAGIIAYTSALPADQNSSKEVYFTGTVESFKSGEEPGNSFGNATFYVQDDSTSKTFYCFRVMGPGNQKFTSADQLKVGDQVTVCGLVVNFRGNTPETVTGKAYCYSINGETTPSTPGDNPGTEPGDEPGDKVYGEVDGNTLTLIPANMGLANASAVGIVNLVDGTVLEFGAGGNNNGPKYYNSGTNIRMYPKNFFKITAEKQIVSVEIDCDTYSGTLCNAEGEVTAEPGTKVVEGDLLLFNDINSQTTTITNANTNTGSASQIRMKKLVITYAE